MVHETADSILVKEGSLDVFSYFHFGFEGRII